ncbi:MBL fold metallo-hydrolase [Nonomuraea sp. PA05]|uniref:MBL fold metallo-hydrolase n=1 Tax=Nonomuraea sp. PA05 TaxID=2604466 RepID=UPI0011DAC793|nr:MBL fold metallo-hydrolase [Nonomuraea sp. PA05]TYB47112.1 MBL fold metallo-hydrolase [Nonomuraea sp. PA05]
MGNQHRGPDAAALHEIVPGVHAWVQPDGTWWVNNAGAVTGDDGTIVIDTCATEARTRRFLDALAAATGGAPIRAAVNTHQHGDHTHGNSLLPEQAVIVGHESVRESVLTDFVIDGCPPFWSPVPDWGGVTRRPPWLVFGSELTVHSGGRRIDLLHPGHPAHTAGDVVAWLPEERVLFTGDLLFHGITPLVLMGSVDGALRSLDWLAGFGAEHVVPGHGPLADAAALPGILAEHERYYRFVAEIAADGMRRELSPLDAARCADLRAFSGWSDAERLVLNLHRAYADAVCTDVDLLAAFGDAVSWNRGPFPTAV